jgi:hypothetical protein
MPKLEPCAMCHHPRHTHGTGTCISKTVTGPADNHPADGSHGNRTVTPCPCTEYVPHLNGAARV